MGAGMRSFGGSVYSEIALVTFSSDQRAIVPSSRSRLAFSVSVLDLDLKPYESIPHQYKLDGKIVSYYSKTVHAKDDAMMSTRFKESEDCTLVLHKV
jgi:inositol-pentakisphosphate 2-kinase